MLLIISPAKTLDFEPASYQEFTQWDFKTESQQLINISRKLTAEDLKKLMGVSDKIAELNVKRFQDWNTPFSLDNAKQAILAFRGDVYTGLDIDTFNASELKHSQKHLRILSGLYGLLRPLDLIQPYRLEMGTRLENDKGINLYKFWDSKIAEALNEALAAQGDETLVNLASNEYFKAVDKKVLKANLITPEFKDLKNGKYKVISFYAKRARGMMARHLLKQAETDICPVEVIKSFKSDGYIYNEALSSDLSPVFTRDPEKM